jgi:hypothetical protein
MKSVTLNSARIRLGLLAAGGAALAMAAVTIPSAAALGSASSASSAGGGHAWYVSASAPAGGSGTQNSPFNSLAAVEQAAGSNDTIIVLPSPATTPPLDGGIALKSGQRLIGAGPSVLAATSSDAAPRLTNSGGSSNSGDVVELANNTTVSNLVIDGSYRGGIYGDNVTGVTIDGNNVSGANTSCTFGFLVLPFQAASDTVPAAGTPAVLNTGVQNGWGSIMIDASQGNEAVTINGNYVHDGICGDGIDVRLTGTARASAQVSGNTVSQLPQGSAVHSVLAIGMQAADSSRLTANVTSNSETYIGSANADCEGLFLNTNGSAVLNENVDHNFFDHGIGGHSCNGFEDIVSSGNSTINATVRNSVFEDNPGDMFQELNFGVGSSMSVLLADSRLSRTTIALGNSNTNNIGECLWTAETGVGDNLQLTVANSSLSGCNNGVSALNNVVSPASQAGSVNRYAIDIDNSQIFGNAYDNIFVNNVDPVQALDHLSVDVQHSELSDSAAPGVLFDQASPSSTADPEIDLGGGPLHSAGQNNIVGNAGAVQAENYTVYAEHDFWGTPAGPAPADLILSGPGSVHYLPYLLSPAS